MIFNDEEMQFLRMRVSQLPHQSVEQELLRRLIENCRKLEEKHDRLKSVAVQTLASR
jgi:hypothetical protein